MGYMVVSLAGKDGHLGAGLTLIEAFVRLMVFAQCDYIFHRVGGVMHLTLHHLDAVPDYYRDDPELRQRYFPEHHSTLADDAMARVEIMRKVMAAGFKGYHVVKDDCSLPPPSPSRGLKQQIVRDGFGSNSAAALGALPDRSF